MKKIFQFVLLFVAIIATNVQAQNNENFTIDFAIEVPKNVDVVEASLLQNAQITMCKYETKHSVIVNMMGGMMNMHILNDANTPKTSSLLYNFMGRKYLVSVDNTVENTAVKTDYLDLSNIVSTTYFKDDKMTIAGYPCYKAVSVLKDKTEIVFYITEALPVNFLYGSKNEQTLAGFPLMFMTKIDATNYVKFTAKSVNFSKAAICEFNSEGYLPIKMEEFYKVFEYNE